MADGLRRRVFVVLLIIVLGAGLVGVLSFEGNDESQAVSSVGGAPGPAGSSPLSPTVLDLPDVPVIPDRPRPEGIAWADVEARQFDADGAEVRTSSVLDTIPDNVTIVQFTTTLIDAGAGFQLCLGGVRLRLPPPACGGPVVDGLNGAGWTESSGDTAWGRRTVTVTWPPNEGHVTLIHDETPRSSGGDVPEPGAEHLVLPEACAAITNFVSGDTILAYAADNQDRTDHPRSVDNGRIIVLPTVEEHLDDVRAELTSSDAEPCLVPVEFSASQLSAAHDRLRASGLQGGNGPVFSSGDGVFNRLLIIVAVADRATIDALTSAFDHPEILRINAQATILEGN